MQIFLSDLKYSLEKLDNVRDRVLFLFIKPYWPQIITPNHLTISRIFISVALFVLLFFYGYDNKAVIISLFCIGALTDLFDGSVARGLNKVTELGAMLDSTADRLLIVPIAVYSLFPQYKWLLLALLLAEIFNSFISIYYKSKEIYLESNIYGKTKMVIQSLVFAAILIVWPNDPSKIFIYALWSTIILTFLSASARIAELKEKIKTPIIKKIIEKYENKI